MSIVLVGLNHRTTPVEMRAQLTLAGCALRMAPEELRIQNRSTPARTEPVYASDAPSILREGVILSTCNCLEVYAVIDDALRDWAEIAHFLSRLQGLSLAQLRPHLYRVGSRLIPNPTLRAGDISGPQAP